MKAKILITGATGTTSQYAIQHLVEKGIIVTITRIGNPVITPQKRTQAIERVGETLFLYSVAQVPVSI